METKGAVRCFKGTENQPAASFRKANCVQGSAERYVRKGGVVRDHVVQWIDLDERQTAADSNEKTNVALNEDSHKHVIPATLEVRHKKLCPRVIEAKARWWGEVIMYSCLAPNNQAQDSLSRSSANHESAIRAVGSGLTYKGCDVTVTT